MTLDTQFRINNNPNYQRYIRENPIWYKILNRDCLQFKNFENEVKDRYGLKVSDKIKRTILPRCRRKLFPCVFA